MVVETGDGQPLDVGGVQRGRHIRDQGFITLELHCRDRRAVRKQRKQQDGRQGDHRADTECRQECPAGRGCGPGPLPGSLDGEPAGVGLAGVGLVSIRRKVLRVRGGHVCDPSRRVVGWPVTEVMSSVIPDPCGMSPVVSRPALGTAKGGPLRGTRPDTAPNERRPVRSVYASVPVP